MQQEAGPDLIIGAIISNGGITKTGEGGIRFDGVNTYTGATTVSAGELILDNGGSINFSTVVQVASGATLTTNDADSLADTAAVTVRGTWTAGGNETIGSLIVIGGTATSAVAGTDLTVANSVTMTAGSIATGAGSLILGGNVTTLASATTATITGNINLNGSTLLAPRFFNVANGAAATDLDISAMISNGWLAKSGAGALEFSGSSANDYAGTFVNGGSLNLNRTAAVDAILGLLTINNSGTVNLLDSNQIADSSTVAVNFGGKLSLGEFSETIAALAMDRGTVQSTGGSLTVGPVTMTGGTIAMDDGTLFLNGNLTTMESSVSAVISGILDLGNATRTFNVAQGAASIDLNVSAVVTGNGGITKEGLGAMSFTGTQANTYSGTTTVNAGILNLSKTAGVTAVAGALIVDISMIEGVGAVRLTTGNQIADASTVTVNAGGSLTLVGAIADTIASLDVVGGTVSLASGSLTVGALAMTGGTITSSSGFLILNGDVTVNTSSDTATISGKVNLNGSTRTFNVADGGAATDLLVSAVMSNGGLTKTGAGVMQITGNNSYTGLTTVDGGTLSGIGRISGAVQVNSGGALATGGTIVGHLTVASGGVFDPGGSSAASVTLQAGATFDAGSTLIIDILSAGSYDLLYVSGGSGVNVSSANLVVRLGYPVLTGHSFSVIVAAAPAYGVVGTFAQGTSVTSSGIMHNFAINYNAATTKSLVLTA